jgi:hyperosmotically inducible periplasmic protein
MARNMVKAMVMGAILLAGPALAATPDGFLTAKTKLSLWTTAGVRSTTVHVDTNDGFVTLYGKVPSNEQKALAEKTARGVADVKGVKNLLQVVPAGQEKTVARADKELLDEARKALKNDATLKNSNISVKSVDKGVVLLSGDAKTFSDHLRAVATIDRLAGVQRVASEVKGPEAFGNDERISMQRYQGTTTATAAAPSKDTAKEKEQDKADRNSSASDMRISAAVKLRLWTAPQVPSTEINVDTTDGTVYLFGMVPTAGIKDAAAAEAGKVDGVSKVENLLEVVPSSEKKTVQAKDEDITRDLKLAFKDRQELKSVSYAVKNGTVRLTGTVSSGWDEMSAVRAARQIPGVRGVEDQIKVEDKSGTNVSGQQ